MGDALAREVLRLDGLFLQDGLKFGREPVEEHLVGEQNLAVEIVIRERELILGFKERVGENREDRVFLGRDDTLLQGRVELGVGDALRVGADRVEGGEKPVEGGTRILTPLRSSALLTTMSCVVVWRKP